MQFGLVAFQAALSPIRLGVPVSSFLTTCCLMTGFLVGSQPFHVRIVAPLFSVAQSEERTAVNREVSEIETHRRRCFSFLARSDALE